MARFGGAGLRWGAPVTVSARHTGAGAPLPTQPGTYPSTDPLGDFVGPELYYAWGVPTGVMAAFEADSVSMTLGLLPGDEKTALSSRLQNFSLEGRRPFGIPASLSTLGGGNTREWVLLPTLRFPLLATGWAGGDLRVMVTSDFDSDILTGGVTRLDEIHLIRAARLYQSGGELTRTVFGGGADNYEDAVARNVVGLRFAYNPTTRLLKMFLAARGNERMSSERQPPPNWPECLGPIDDLSYRLLVKNTTWIIRN